MNPMARPLDVLELGAWKLLEDFWMVWHLDTSNRFSNSSFITFDQHRCRCCSYSCVLNTSHTVLGDMPNFYENPVCITRHAIPFYERPGCNTEHTNSLLMWQWHHYCFEVTREGLRPGCNSRHGTLFTQRPGWNKRIWGKIQWVLNRSPVTCIQD